MIPDINNKNLFKYAWKVAKPYVMEIPSLLFDEFSILTHTTYICNIMTSPECLFEFLSFCRETEDGKIDPVSNMAIEANICKMKSYKKILDSKKLDEIIDMTNIFSAFLNLFSRKDEEAKKEYVDLLTESFYDYKEINFCYITTHSLQFESFNDMITYLDELYDTLELSLVLTRNMIEIICSLIPPVISKVAELNYVLSPSYAYPSLLPFYVAKERSSNKLVVINSLTFSRCFMFLEKDNFFEQETPSLFNYIIKKISESLTENIFSYLSEKSILNNDILKTDDSKPASNIFNILKNIAFFGHNIEIYSYNGSSESYIAAINLKDNKGKFIYISDKFLKKNKAPLNLEILQTFFINKNSEAKILTTEEDSTVRKIISNIEKKLKKE